MRWNNATIPFNPGLGKWQTNGPVVPLNTTPISSRAPKPQVDQGVNSSAGIHAILNQQVNDNTKRYQFNIPLQLRGSESINFVPMGKLTQVNLESNWANPSFQGGILPDREITSSGFKAKWQIPFLGRNFPQQWNNDRPVDENTIYQSRFGVDLFTPVDNYHMAERSIKYNFLFLVLTFAVLWLFEVTAGLRFTRCNT